MTEDQYTKFKNALTRHYLDIGYKNLKKALDILDRLSIPFHVPETIDYYEEREKYMKALAEYAKTLPEYETMKKIKEKY